MIFYNFVMSKKLLQRKNNYFHSMAVEVLNNLFKLWKRNYLSPKTKK